MQTLPQGHTTIAAQVNTLIDAVHDALPPNPPAYSVLEALGVVAAQYLLKLSTEDARLNAGAVSECARDILATHLEQVINRSITAGASIRTPLGPGRLDLNADMGKKIYGLTFSLDV